MFEPIPGLPSCYVVSFKTRERAFHYVCRGLQRNQRWPGSSPIRRHIYLGQCHHHIAKYRNEWEGLQLSRHTDVLLILVPHPLFKTIFRLLVWVLTKTLKSFRETTGVHIVWGGSVRWLATEDTCRNRPLKTLFFSQWGSRIICCTEQLYAKGLHCKLELRTYQ